MSDLAAIGVAAAPMTVLGIFQVILSILHRRESREEHLTTKKAVDGYREEVNGHMAQLLKAAVEQGRLEGMEEQKNKDAGG